MKAIYKKIKAVQRNFYNHKFKYAAILSILSILISEITMEEIIKYIASCIGLIVFILLMSNLPFVLANGIFFLVIYCIYRIITE